MSGLEPLSPKVVHDFSQKVYATDGLYRNIKRANPNLGEDKIIAKATGRLDLALGTNSMIDLQGTNFLAATSGMFQINQLTGFGFIAQGQGGRKGELVLATRGTNFSSNKYDLATDANIGYGIAPEGEHDAKVTPLGQMPSFVQFLKKAGRFDQ